MKRFLSILFLSLFLTTVFAEDLVKPVVIPVDFTYQTGVNTGFSTTQAGIELVKSVLGTEENAITFTRNGDSITTGPFYFYVQIYTTNKVAVSVVDTDFKLSGYDNNGNATSESISYTSTPSLASGKVLYSEKNVTDANLLNYPRVENIMLELKLDPDELLNKTATKYTGSLTFKVETTT